MHLLLCDHDCEPFLQAELARRGASAPAAILAPGLLHGEFTPAAGAPPLLVFARQCLPFAEARQAASINAWAQLLFAEFLAKLPEDQPWQLQVTPHYLPKVIAGGTGVPASRSQANPIAHPGADNAGQNRCRLIREALLELLARKRRRLRRALREAPATFTEKDSLAQLLLTAPDQGFLAVAPAPLPQQWRQLVWPFPNGEIPVASDKAPPSRAFAKLLEAEQRLGRRIAAGETCVDLGASPGSWTHVALHRGARVTAVDRAPLREDLMRHPRLEFHQGDAFKFTPAKPVDWLLCDVIAAPQRSVDLLLEWVRQRRARRFVVTIKFKGHAEYTLLDQLKTAMPELCREFYLTRLCANKNEACAFGELLPAA